MANSGVDTQEEIASTIHRALVEVMTLRQANLTLQIGRNANSPTSTHKRRIAKDARFKIGSSDQFSLILEHEGLQQDILGYIHPKEQNIKESERQKQEDPDFSTFSEESEEATVQATESDLSSVEEEIDTTSSKKAEIYDTWPEENAIDDRSSCAPVDDSWLEVSLADPEFKFAVG